MADAPVDSACTVYSCRCLNVRIYPAHTQATPPLNTPDPKYTHVHVGEDGIHVVHPHVTLRTREKGLPIGGTSRCGRYTTLTCLVCEVLVYRVYQVVPLDIEGKDGPLFPTEEWVENEVMKSSSGWIEVSTKCVTNDDVKVTESSPDFSPLFSIVLPKLPPPSPTMQVGPEIPVATPRSPSPEPEPPISYLGGMKPLIPPAPFTPSHPVFRHLASKAIARSETLRAEAEEHITRVVQREMVEVESAEDELREQLEAVWFKFKATVDKIKKRDKSNTSPHPSVPQDNHEAASDSLTIPRVTVREFVPVSTTPARAISSSESPRVSALSASLATSSFYHPKDKMEPQPSAQETNGSTRPPSSNSATLVHSPSREGGVNVLQFPRNIDDALNTAVSFKYFLDLEEEIKRTKKERVEEANRKYQATQAEAGPSQDPAINGKKVDGKKPKAHEAARGKHVQVDTEGSIVEPSERSPTKAGRHVTFDVEPEVVTINSEAAKNKAELNGENEREAQDMMFELEDAEGESYEQSPGPKQTLPLLEQPAARPARHRKVRSLTSAGLPSSLSSLRPVSLPPPSHIRPPRSRHGVDSSSHNAMLPLPKSSALDQQKQRTSADRASAEVPEGELDPRDAVILRLVAAGTPSHRGAWKPDSQAWKSFTRSSGKDRSDIDASEDEADTGEDSPGLDPSELSTGESTGPSSDGSSDPHQHQFDIPGSLPIPIGQLKNKKMPLSLASYQPRTSLGDHRSAIMPPLGPKSPSAAALRRASYAERDRQRAMDPGALDFAGQEGDEEAGSSEEEVVEALEDDIGTRSRKQALRILQKSSEVPEEGMWRSLAA